MALVGQPIEIGTSSTTLMTVPATLEASLHSLLISNPTGGNLDVTLSFFDSGTSSELSLLTQTVTSDTTLKAFDAPINMAAGDKVNASASGTGLVALVSRFENSSTPAEVGFTARGNYTATTTYAVNDVVFLESDSNSYLSRTGSNLNNIPSSNPNNWQVFGAVGQTGSISANPTLVNPVLSGDFTTSSGNFDIDPATQIVEIKGNGSDTEGQIKLNCHANSHGQTIKAQPHSEGETNTMLLPKGADSTLVSEVGTASLSNKVFDIVSDTKGDVRDLQISQSSGSTYTLTTNDTGQMVRLNSAGIQALIPSSTFDAGDIVSIMNTTSTTGSITSQITMHVGGGVSATGTATLGINNIANIYFVSADGCIVTGGAS
tara:strand:+ start:1361 stop:2485 length:1125 start_codon:yes stop_codon:yes gene_type:complete